MHRCTLVWVLLGFVTTGCHRARVPDLPASHGRLSLFASGFTGYPSLAAQSYPATGLFGLGAEQPLSPAHAPAAFAEAVQVLNGRPTDPEVARAAARLHAACAARFQAACAFLEDEFKPEKIGHIEAPRFPPEMDARMQLGLVSLACQVGTDGLIRNCVVFERAPYAATRRFLDAVAQARASPPTLAGHPLEMPHAFTYIIDPTDDRLTREQELQFARHRVTAFPKSPAAWDFLARLLTRNVTEGPEYPGILRRLNELVPRYWWAANELAWLEVQAGNHAKALPLATMAQAEAPVNPYVLETLAATLRGLGRCEEALAEQRRAVERVPSEWPEPERARFARVLTEYQQQCTEGAPKAPPPH